MSRITAFRITLLISLGLHWLVLFVVIEQDHSLTPATTTIQDPIFITLESSAPASDTRAPEPEVVSLASVGSVAKTPEVGDSTPPERKQTAATPPAIEPATVVQSGLKQSPSSMIAGFVERENSEAFRASLIPDCTLPELVSEVRICEPDDRELTGQRPVNAFAGTFSNAFRPLDSKRSNFSADIDMIEKLMRRREELAEVRASDELQAAFVAEERRLIADQILRIDRKYQQVNLLRLVPAGINVVTRLLDVAKK